MPPALSITIIAVSTLIAGAIGIPLGQPFAYAIARAIGRDAAEIKDTFVWCALLFPLVCAAAGGWLASMAMRSRFRRPAMIGFVATASLCGAIAFASYDPPKTAGIPIIAYELRMPATIRADGIGSIDLTIWSGGSGTGCYISGIRDEGSHRLIAGSVSPPSDDHDPMLSIAFHDGERWTQGGAWKLNHGNRTAIETEFGPWETIDFSGRVRDLPMSEGRFEIRYRLRRFM